MKLAIYGHYHCRKDGAVMRPVVRLPYRIFKGVSCIHVCPKCDRQFIETEE